MGPILYTIYTNNLPDCANDGCIYMYADDTTVFTFGLNVGQVIKSLNSLMSQISKWSSLSKLTIHPSKTEAMILRKQQFVGPTQPIYFCSGYVNLVNTTNCLGVTINKNRFRNRQIDLVKTSFSKKVVALRRVSYLPKSALEEIYFKVVIQCYLCNTNVGNCSQSLLHSLKHIHARACRMINHLPTILDKTVGKVSTFEVFIASLPSPLLQCCAKLNGFSGKLLTYLPTLNRGEGGYVRESETISFEH